MKIIKTITLLASLLLVACGGGWSSEDSAAYIEACKSGGQLNDSYCQCNLDYLKDNFSSPDDITSEDSGLILEAAESCAYHLY